MNSAVVFALDVTRVRLAHLAGIVPIAHVALMQWTRQNACCARVAPGAVLSGRTTSRPAETVPSEDTRQPLEFWRSQGVIHAVLDDSLLPLEPLLRLLANLVRKADTNVLKVTLHAMHAHKAMEVMRDLQPA